MITTTYTVLPSDVAKQGRVNPRNFAAMTDSTVRAMAQRTFRRPFLTKAEAVSALKELPIPFQHALSKTQAQRDAAAWQL